MKAGSDSSPIYLDHHATTPVDPRVRDAMWPWFTERCGNPASTSHGYGHRAAAAVAYARLQIASALNCDHREILFTSGATEANNLAIKGVLAGAGGGLITAAAEHRAVLDPARRLQRAGCKLTVLSVDPAGAIDPAALEAALSPDTRLVSLMWANNEVGTIHPVAEFAAICRRRGVLLHSDAAQALGTVPLDLAATPVDLVSFSAHKLYGPQGIGALFVRREPRIAITPQIDGGGHERGLRSGTLPVPLIVGFGEAVRIAVDDRIQETQRLTGLRERLLAGLKQVIPGLVLHGPVLDGPAERRLPGNLNVGIPDVDGEALLVRLSSSPLAVSSGSACTSANPEPSHVLRAMGVNDRLARASLRFGIGRFNTVSEIDRAVAIVADCIHAVSSRG